MPSTHPVIIGKSRVPWMVLAVIPLAVATVACTSSGPAPAKSHPASGPATSAARRAPGGRSAFLNRPLHLPMLRPGQRCPASQGSSSPVTIGGDTGTVFGNGPVRVLMGASRHGVIGLLTHTNTPPWLGFKTLWFSLPRYQGPFVIRAERLGHPGPISLTRPPAMAPLIVPREPAIDTVPVSNGRPGYRKIQSVFWVRSPGCYAWQVDGLSFSETIVVRAVQH
jgi:hypothetical protein